LPLKFEANKSLKECTTFKIGGLAQFFCVVHSIKNAICALRFAKKYKLPFVVIGKGSNCLIDDRGYKGLVILNKIHHCKVENNVVTVGSGYSFSHLGLKTVKKGLKGLEFASGIPATVGGAIFMNAGANEQETSAYLKSVTFLTQEAKIMHFTRDDLTFSYRNSSFQNKKGMIIDACFVLTCEKNSKITQKNLLDYRRKTQPYSKPSAGCIFRNPSSNVSAGYLIDKCGLKGKQIGGACVSEKHANFIINKNHASCQDVIQLIYFIQKIIKEKTGYDLIPEIKYISYESYL